MSCFSVFPKTLKHLELQRLLLLPLKRTSSKSVSEKELVWRPEGVVLRSAKKENLTMTETRTVTVNQSAR